MPDLAGYGLFGFNPDGGTFNLMSMQQGVLSRWPLTGSFVNVYGGFTNSLQTTMIKVGQSGQNDVLYISNGTDNPKIMYQDYTVHDLGSGSTSPDKTVACCYYMNRVWTLLKNISKFSDAFSSDYSTAFSSTNAFRVPVGTARALIPTRDQGIVFFGSDQIWQLQPSVVPDPTTDFPQKVLDIGCSSGNTAVQVADDIIFLAPDGIRGLFRTQLDKLQTGQSYPLSWVLQDRFDSINWNKIDKACAVFYQNKYIIALPTGTSNYNNEVWVYYPALSTAFYASTNTSQMATERSWVVYKGWNIARFAELNVNGLQTLFGIDAVTGQMYQLFDGTDDNGTPIEFDYQSKAEDFKAPMQYKFGGEFKVKVKGGVGTLTVNANADGLGWVKLGDINTVLSGVTFPTQFPINFENNSETNGVFHLDDSGIIKFKRCKFELYCNSDNADITVLETLATAFQEPYLGEG